MVTVKKYSSREDAELARHQLEAAGIHAYLGGDNGGGLLGSITTGGYNIEVNQPDKEQALEVLAAMGQDDDISDAELEALAMAEPGTEQAVEPSFEEEPAEPDHADSSKWAWKGLCWGCAAGVLLAVAQCLYKPAEIEVILPTLTWRVPFFGLLGVMIATYFGKAKS